LLTEEQNDFLQLKADQKDAAILQEETYVDSVLGGLDPAELSCNVSYYNEASRFGEYTNLTRTVYYGISVSDPSQYISLINRSDTSSQVYYKDSAAPMQLSDVFKVGTEWPTMIHYCIQQNIKDLEPESEYTEEQLTEWANFLMNDITGFSLGSDYLTLYYEDIYHHAQEFFPGVADDEIWKFSTGPQMIHYEDLGYHILNIFR